MDMGCLGVSVVLICHYLRILESVLNKKFSIYISRSIEAHSAQRAGGHTKPLQACECHIRGQKYPLRTQGPLV